MFHKCQNPSCTNTNKKRNKLCGTCTKYYNNKTNLSFDWDCLVKIKWMKKLKTFFIKKINQLRK